MKWVGIIAAFVIVAYYAHSIGYMQAVKYAPEYVAAKKAEREADEQFWKDLEQVVTPRERLCDEIIESVRELLDQEHIDDMQELLGADRY